MSKFIRLTDSSSGKHVYLNPEQVELFVQSDGETFVCCRNSMRVVTETPEQILALIEGDESGLKERVAFLEQALWQAVNKTGMHFEQQTIMTEGAGWFSGNTPELKEWLNNCGVIL